MSFLVSVVVHYLNLGILTIFLCPFVLSNVNGLLAVVRTCFAGCIIVYILIGAFARLSAVITYMRVARYARVRACYDVFILCYYARRALEVNISTHPCNVLGLDPFTFRYMGRTFL